MHIVTVTLSNNKLIAGSSHGPIRHATTEGNLKAILTNVVLRRAIDHSTGHLITQCFAMLNSLTLKLGDAPLFKNSDEELDYIWHEYAGLGNQCKMKYL